MKYSRGQLLNSLGCYGVFPGRSSLYKAVSDLAVKLGAPSHLEPHAPISLHERVVHTAYLELCREGRLRYGKGDA